ncbi:MAG: RHS repeat-associated core domain-containing protein, partial [Chloroflexota bacterium]
GTTITRETVANPFRYLGAVLDASTGLYHLGARLYDPRLGRFTQPDPSNTGAPGDYTYGGDAPSSLSDPTGLASVAVAGGGGHFCHHGWICLSRQELDEGDAIAKATMIIFHAFLVPVMVLSMFGIAVPVDVAGLVIGVVAQIIEKVIKYADRKCFPSGIMIAVRMPPQWLCWY